MRTILHGSWTQGCAGFAPTVLRLATGLVFAMHGWQKLSTMGVEGVAGFLASLGFPAATLFAVLLIAIELLGGIALILGAFTYWAAALSAIVAFVAFFTVHVGNGFFIGGNGYEFILVLFAASVSLMLTGPGKWSVRDLMR